MALRKMLGSVDHPQIIRLMRLIESQNKATLMAFASEAAARYLPIAGEAARLTAALEAVQAHLRGETSLRDVKPLLRDARAAAQEEKDPIRQAAKRAVARLPQW